MVLRLKWLIGICVSLNIIAGVVANADNSVKFKKQKIELSYEKKKKIISVEVAETPEQHSQGLMFRKSLNSNEGMLFVFSDSKVREFWMKNTLINLDIAYFDQNKKIIDIQQMKAISSLLIKEIPTYPSQQPAQYALEMSEGWFKKNKFGVGTVFKTIPRP